MRHGAPRNVLQGLSSAYVLIFNAGRQDEGVYTLQARVSQARANVLAFELDDNAKRFAQLLCADGFVRRRPSLACTCTCPASPMEVASLVACAHDAWSISCRSQDLATSTTWEAGTLDKFCTTGSFEVSLVPKGTLIMPPAKNEYDKDAFDRLHGPPADAAPDMRGVQERNDIAGANGYAPSEEGRSIDTSSFASERERLERLFKSDS